VHLASAAVGPRTLSAEKMRNKILEITFLEVGSTGVRKYRASETRETKARHKNVGPRHTSYAKRCCRRAGSRARSAIEVDVTCESEEVVVEVLVLIEMAAETLSQNLAAYSVAVRPQ
jgi:hypothetical protein